MYIRGPYRSASLISLSSSMDPQGYRQVRRKILDRTRTQWHAVLLSFVLIACFLMVIIFLYYWNERMTGKSKEFRPQRLRGPFGRLETSGPNNEVTDERGKIIPQARAKVEPLPTTITERTEKYTGDYFAPRLGATETASAECNTSVCRVLRKWFVSTVVSQANPCRKRNRFICDNSMSLPHFGPSVNKVPAVNRKLASTEGTDAVAKAMAVKSQSKKQPQDSNQLLHLCFQYAMTQKDGVEDIQLFLSHFNLEFCNIVEDSKECPLTRMMELSLDYGVDVPVSFTRKHNVTGDGSQAFVLQINLNEEVNEFFMALDGLDETEVKEFYKLCLSQYALLHDTSFAEELIDADDEIADVVNRPANSNGLASIDVASLSEHTGVAAGRWRQLLDLYHSRSQVGQHGNVSADERALGLLAYMSRPGESLRMRRLLAWHVLLYLVGPKAELLKALYGTQGERGAPNHDVFAGYAKQRCERMMTKLEGVRYRALDILEGDGAVPVEIITKVATFMAQFQSAVAFVYNSSQQNVKFASPAVSKTPAPVTAGKEVGLFPKLTSQNGTLGELFTAVKGVKKDTGSRKEEEVTEADHSFPLLWLRHLRAWHALPPLVQALLPVMVSLDNERPASFFRLPYYDARALPAYNFAGLGQVIARAFVHRTKELLSKNPAMSERGNSFLGATGVINPGATYCLVNGRKQNGISRQRTPNATRGSERVIWDQGSTLKLSYLAFLRSRRVNAGTTKPMERLPGIRLSREQLFLTMHCALSCSMGTGNDTNARQMTTRNKCVVDYMTTLKHFFPGPCANSRTMNNLDECSYL
ncbi:uncharacterized protein [Dermacentor albipictus]|uniref:uncharacterized protein isoform X1 n=1 Tax=Dermacentor albipictus TaxID=60249 RepID=UPI0031FCA702